MSYLKSDLLSPLESLPCLSSPPLFSRRSCSTSAQQIRGNAEERNQGREEVDFVGVFRSLLHLRDDLQEGTFSPSRSLSRCLVSSVRPSVLPRVSQKGARRGQEDDDVEEEKRGIVTGLRYVASRCLLGQRIRAERASKDDRPSATWSEWVGQT